jgi:hypothetical protein
VRKYFSSRSSVSGKARKIRTGAEVIAVQMADRIGPKAMQIPFIN